MAYDAAQLLTEARRLLNEAAEGFFSDTDISAWIVQGTLDVSVKARCVEAEMPIIFASSARSYAAPTDSIGIEAVLIGGKPLAKGRHRMFGSNSQDPGEPSMYAHYARKIWVTPIPDSSYSGTVLYWKRTDTYTDIPEEYQLLVLLYAVRQGKLKDRKYTEAAQLQSMYLQELEFQRMDLQERRPDSRAELRIPDTITST